MTYGICLLSVVPGRLEPDDTSEMVTQLLFGELYRVVDERKKWVKIRTVHDGYECWIDRKQHYRIKRTEFKILNESPKIFTSDLISVIRSSDERYFPVVLGSRLPGSIDNKFSINGIDYEHEGEILEVHSPNRYHVIEMAWTLLHAPYLWGGRSPLGIDCSGYVQLVYRMCGVDLPRDASEQAQLGKRLSFIEESVPGDLAFFDNKDGHIVHVGILLNDNRIIHASGQVRIDRIDHQGIYNNDIRNYTHHLRLITRILPE